MGQVEIRLHSSFLYTLLDVKSLRLNCAQKQVKKSDYGHKNEKGSKNEEPPSSYPTTVVFKIDMHCDECASKIIKCLHAFRGFQTWTKTQTCFASQILINLFPVLFIYLLSVSLIRLNSRIEINSCRRCGEFEAGDQD